MMGADTRGTGARRWTLEGTVQGRAEVVDGPLLPCGERVEVEARKTGPSPPDRIEFAQMALGGMIRELRDHAELYGGGERAGILEAAGWLESTYIEGEDREVVEVSSAGERDVEAAACALWERDHGKTQNWVEQPSWRKRQYRDMARVALSASAGDAERVLANLALDYIAAEDEVRRGGAGAEDRACAVANKLSAACDRILREAGGPDCSSGSGQGTGEDA